MNQRATCAALQRWLHANPNLREKLPAGVLAQPVVYLMPLVEADGMGKRKMSRGDSRATLRIVIDESIIYKRQEFEIWGGSY
jgi:hypothetical protein